MKCTWQKEVWDYHLLAYVTVDVVRNYGPFETVDQAKKYSQSALKRGCSGRHDVYLAKAARVSPAPIPIIWSETNPTPVGPC